jgi:NhaP-type Na+/H+ and K+/H+ antiporter
VSIQGQAGKDNVVLDYVPSDVASTVGDLERLIRILEGGRGLGTQELMVSASVATSLAIVRGSIVATSTLCSPRNSICLTLGLTLRLTLGTFSLAVLSTDPEISGARVHQDFEITGRCADLDLTQIYITGLIVSGIKFCYE